MTKRVEKPDCEPCVIKHLKNVFRPKGKSLCRWQNLYAVPVSQSRPRFPEEPTRCWGSLWSFSHPTGQGQGLRSVLDNFLRPFAFRTYYSTSRATPFHACNSSIWEKAQDLQKHEIVFWPLSRVMYKPLELPLNLQHAQYLGSHSSFYFWNEASQKHRGILFVF